VADTNDPPPVVMTQIEETIRSVGQLHAEHHEKATPAQRTVERMTSLLGRPALIGALSIVVAGWIGLNLFADAQGYRPLDRPPFPWLSGAVSLVSLYTVVLILATQRRKDQLAQQRELLLLQMAVLGEQKMAKMIELLEESRRDNPLIHNRVDQEADEMARPADPQSVLDAIKETHAKTRQDSGPTEEL
jgi:uncharacterized membrane protein